jgi:hypothetical protein
MTRPPFSSHRRRTGAWPPFSSGLHRGEGQVPAGSARRVRARVRLRAVRRVTGGHVMRSRARCAFEAALLLAVSMACAARPAAAWGLRGDAPESDFRDFERRFSGDVYDYPRHGAAPLGLAGFEVWADASVDSGFGGRSFRNTVIAGSLPGRTLTMLRAGVRKGLPAGIDLGVSYGQALGGGPKLAAADIQWAIVKGGALSPALSLRLTGARSLKSDPYYLQQYGAELLVSKGFPALTPYAGAGLVESRGRLDSTLGSSLRDNRTHAVLYAGVTLNLLLPKIHIEVEHAEVTQAAIRIGFGL